MTCQAQNVETCVWDFGADKPLEVTSESPNQQEKLVTFATPGKYFVQLAVLNGKQSERKWVPVVVEPAPANSLMAVLSVVDQGMRTDSFQETVNVTLGADAGTRPFERHLPAPHGYLVADARLAGLPPVGVRNIAVLLRADHKSVNVTGETQPNAKPSQTGGPPMIVIPIAALREAGRRKPSCGAQHGAPECARCHHAPVGLLPSQLDQHQSSHGARTFRRVRTYGEGDHALLRHTHHLAGPTLHTQGGYQPRTGDDHAEG